MAAAEVDLDAGMASWVCDLCSHIGPCTEKGPMFGLMLC